MQLSIILTLVVSLVTYARAKPQHDIAMGTPQDQMPLAVEQERLTRTQTMTRTRYEITVVSTVYRTRTHGTHAEGTPVHPDEAKQTLVFGVEGTGCDHKACTICRMLNNCSDDQSDCTGCDLAYYCNQCASKDKVDLKHVNELHIQKTCTDGQGRSVSCNAVEQAIAERNRAFHFGG